MKLRYSLAGIFVMLFLAHTAVADPFTYEKEYQCTVNIDSLIARTVTSVTDYAFPIANSGGSGWIATGWFTAKCHCDAWVHPYPFGCDSANHFQVLKPACSQDSLLWGAPLNTFFSESLDQYIDSPWYVFASISGPNADTGEVTKALEDAARFYAKLWQLNSTCVEKCEERYSGPDGREWEAELGSGKYECFDPISYLFSLPETCDSSTCVSNGITLDSLSD